MVVGMVSLLLLNILHHSARDSTGLLYVTLGELWYNAERSQSGGVHGQHQAPI
jgi:hypothetical protein